VFIRPDLQRNGLGKMIMEKLERVVCLKEIRMVYLDASLFAYQFYKALGYQTISKEAIEVNGEEKLNYFEMRKKLN
jgi:N-acetylglutamate synthase-like GNAT family acetyltransferase